MKYYILSFILIITSIPLQIIVHKILTANFEWLDTDGYGMCLFLSQLIFLFAQVFFAIKLFEKAEG